MNRPVRAPGRPRVARLLDERRPVRAPARPLSASSRGGRLLSLHDNRRYLATGTTRVIISHMISRDEAGQDKLERQGPGTGHAPELLQNTSLIS
jgi:hypothetical protein